jgi:NADH dehydrogenase [ubiquinone] 1 alpha subcomplex assembly factor 5
VTAPLFDHRLRALRRDRAVKNGLDGFLFDRAYDDCLDRVDHMRRRFEHALIAGSPNPDWPERLGRRVPHVTVIDPSARMAVLASGFQADLESMVLESDRFDLCISIGLLDTANDLPFVVANVRRVLKDDGLFIGAIAGGQSLPRLRRAMLAADGIAGQAAPHIHPRIEAASLAQLFGSAGFSDPVVDVDRVELNYQSLDSCVRDLRAMASTNILTARPRRPILRRGIQAAREAFLGGEAKATEQVEILHFAAWNRA